MAEPALQKVFAGSAEAAGCEQPQGGCLRVQRAHHERKSIFPVIWRGTPSSDGLSYFVNVRQRIPWTEAPRRRQHCVRHSIPRRATQRRPPTPSTVRGERRCQFSSSAGGCGGVSLPTSDGGGGGGGAKCWVSVGASGCAPDCVTRCASGCVTGIGGEEDDVPMAGAGTVAAPCLSLDALRPADLSCADDPEEAEGVSHRLTAGETPGRQRLSR
jgi:hypothetical protein